MAELTQPEITSNNAAQVSDEVAVTPRSGNDALSPDTRESTPNHEHNAARRDKWRLLIQALTFIAGFVFMFINVNQWWTAREQLTAATRPWVKVDMTLDSLRWDEEGGMNLEITYRIENTGHSPARNVWVVSAVGNGKDDSTLDERCFSEKRFDETTEAYALTLFPNQSSEQHSVLTLRKEDLAAGRTPSGNVYPSLAGCAIYDFSNDNSQHRTRFFHTIYRKGGNSFKSSEGDLSKLQLESGPYVGIVPGGPPIDVQNRRVRHAFDAD